MFSISQRTGGGEKLNFRKHLRATKSHHLFAAGRRKIIEASLAMMPRQASLQFIQVNQFRANLTARFAASTGLATTSAEGRRVPCAAAVLSAHISLAVTFMP